jgi:mannose-6-phosphate isomerase-like protein (cupin superfamily)
MAEFAGEILKKAMGEEVVPRKQRRNPVDHWTPAVLLERAAYLRKMAKLGSGAASETLRSYPQHVAILSFRSRSGEVQVHEKFADHFYVLAGAATMAMGGAVSGARMVAPGETRGEAIEGGERQELRAGDMIHVPAGVPHQILLAGDKTITCFVLKVEAV